VKTKPLEVKVLNILLLVGRNVPEDTMLGRGRRSGPDFEISNLAPRKKSLPKQMKKNK